jgi:Uma2 family endonuclease
MSTAPILAPQDRSHDPDQRVILGGIDWWQFEAFLAIRGDRAGVRVTYLEGELEIMSSSRTHETRTKLISRLLETYADETELVFEGYGSLTMRNAGKLCAIEPDECYAVGAAKEFPDLAVDVIWTDGGLDKLDVYRGLGVREVWICKKDQLKAYELRGGAYVEISQSVVIPVLHRRVSRLRNTDRGDPEDAGRAAAMNQLATLLVEIDAGFPLGVREETDERHPTIHRHDLPRKRRLRRPVPGARRGQSGQFRPGRLVEST